MGLDYSVYLGVYLECKTHKVDSYEKRNTCSNKKCSKYKQNVWDKETKFCAKCGSVIEEREILTKVDNVMQHEFCEMVLKEKLMPPFGDSMYLKMEKENFHLYLSNQTNIGDHIDARREENIIPIDSDLIAKEIFEFQGAFKKEIEIIKEKYGEENVEIKYGLINYIS